MPSGDKVKSVLRSKDMTQAELARKTGISESQLSHILSSNRNVKEITLRKICDGLGCNPEDIMLGGTDGE